MPTDDKIKAPGMSKAIGTSLQLTYRLLRLVLPHRKHGCLCDRCLLDEIAIATEAAGAKEK